MTQELKQELFYQVWQRNENIPVITGLAIEDMNAVQLAPWTRSGGNGAFVDLGTRPGIQGGSYICEIPAGGELKPQKHMFDEGIYITQGRGATTIWNPGMPKQMVEWQEGSLLAIPLNANYQHFNTGSTPARFFSSNNAAAILNQYANEKFVFDNPFVFDDRFQGEAGYFNGEGTLYSVPKESYRVWETNFVPDARNMELYEWKERGAGGVNVMLQMAETVCPHISQFPVGTYKKGHIHNRGYDTGGGALLVILGGEGYTLVWPPGGERQMLPWKQNGVVVAPNSYYHQHFNSGTTPARYLAMIGIGTRRNRTGLKNVNDMSEKQGGSQIEYPDENPEVHQIFEAELAKHGASCRMSELSPFCSTKVAV